MQHFSIYKLKGYANNNNGILLFSDRQKIEEEEYSHLPHLATEVKNYE